MFFSGALIVGGWGVVRWVKKSYLQPPEIASFSSRDFRRSNKHGTSWHAVSTGYFYVLFLWAIAVSNIRPLKIYKKLGLSLSTITFTVKSHANNHFYKYIYFKYYTVWNQFFILTIVSRFLVVINQQKLCCSQ